MSLKGIEAAGRPELVTFAAAIADNGRSLLADAELLLGSGRLSRAYALAVLAIEEFGKAMSIITLALMPAEFRAQTPVRDLLERHVIKQMGGMILAGCSSVPRRASRPGSALLPLANWRRCWRRPGLMFKTRIA